MKRTLCLSVAALVLLFAPALARATDSADEAELRRIKTELWPRAYREQDTALLDEILHPDFQSIDAAGTVTRKDDEIAYIRANRPSYTSFRYEIERLEIFDGAFAVISGRGLIENRRDGKPTWMEYRSSNHFVKRDGTWKAVSSHVSGVRDVKQGE